MKGQTTPDKDQKEKNEPKQQVTQQDRNEKR
jgi:hypothetical protein